MRRIRLLAHVLLIVGLYYLLPVLEPMSSALVWLRAAAATLLLILGVWLVGRQVVQQVRADCDDVRLDRLLLAVVTGVVFFALADFVVAQISEGQFVGLATKTDALYFALTTLTTVGFGDVHAAGQLARALVIVQLLFNVVVLASAARVLSRGIAARTRTGLQRR